MEFLKASYSILSVDSVFIISSVSCGVQFLLCVPGAFGTENYPYNPVQNIPAIIKPFKSSVSLCV